MRALILVDIQNDFVPGGALAVAEGDQVVSVANALMPRFDLVVATQDWHPPEHRSFASNNPGHEIGELIELDGLPQVMWPDHCVQTSSGADFVWELNTDGIDQVFRKGTDPNIDSYSGFFDNGHRKETGLAQFLHKHQVTSVVVVGLATDYCVKWTALDAVNEGFQTTVVREGVRGVELEAGDVQRAFAEMETAGVTVATLPELT